MERGRGQIRHTPLQHGEVAGHVGPIIEQRDVEVVEHGDSLLCARRCSKYTDPG